MARCHGPTRSEWLGRMKSWSGEPKPHANHHWYAQLMTVYHPHHFRSDFVMYACIPVSWCYHPATTGHQTSTMFFLMHFSISSELRRTYVSMQFFQFTVGIGVKRGEVIERIWQVGLIIWRNLNAHRANRATENNCIISLWKIYVGSVWLYEYSQRKTNRV